VNKQWLRAIAAQTVEITQVGGYRAGSGDWVGIRDAVRAAAAGTRLYVPGAPLPSRSRRAGAAVVEVTNESTLAAARRLGGDTAALVFASARNPGGGFLTGARAQEEDVARASALHACLSRAPAFYLHHRAHADPRYSDRVIYSPGVPVFRDDALHLLDRPHRTAMLTAAAPNLRALRANRPDLAATVPAVLRARAVRILEVAAAHGHRRLVLGAWGCGVFGNDPTAVADAFSAALDRVDAAVLDRTPGSATYNAFARGRFSAV
jgi:uncharacterized protein (TIGR02452 family)